jgi:hypothetical protein
MPTGNYPLESTVEVKTTEYAQNKGCLVIKLNILGRRGWPDRLFIYKGQVLFIEFKRQGEQPRKLQVAIHGRIRSHGINVDVVDTLQQGIATIDHFTHGR